MTLILLASWLVGRLPTARTRLVWPGLIATMALVTFLAGCGSTASGLLMGGTPANLNSNDQPMARPKYAGWIAAGAKRCGFIRSPEAIKAAYLAYETKQGATKQQLATLQENFDLSWKSTYEQAGMQPNYCTDKRVAEIKSAFRRQDGGDYAPSFPKPEADTCGVLGCPPSPAPDEPFTSKGFYDGKDNYAR